MTRPSTATSLAGLALIATLIGACGGSTPAGSDAPDGSGGTATDVVNITGGETGIISAPGGCGEDVGDASSWNAIFQTDAGDWMLDITLEGTMEPGRYPIGDHEAGKATVRLFEGGGGAAYDAEPGAGVVDVEEGRDHGSIDAEFTTADGTSVKVVGDWICES